MRRRLVNGRTEELLDGVLRLAAAEGFSGLKVADFARELHCSVATLYKLAPTKFDLICVALERWGRETLLEAEARSLECSDPSPRARTYYRAGAERVRELSPAFRRDVDRFAATRQTWRKISDGFIDRFSELLQEAADTGEIRLSTPRSWSACSDTSPRRSATKTCLPDPASPPERRCWRSTPSSGMASAAILPGRRPASLDAETHTATDGGL